MKIICGVRHFFNPKIGGHQSMSDYTYKQFKKDIMPMLTGKKVLFISEGSNLGTIKPHHSDYQHLVQMLHPNLFRFCQKEKVDLLCLDPRFSPDLNLHATDYVFLDLKKNLEELGKMVEVTSPIPKKLHQLEAEIKNGALTWQFKQEATDLVRSFKKEIAEMYCKCDQAFVKQINESESSYDYVVLIVGLSHFINLKVSQENAGFNFINLVEPGSTPTDFIALAHVCYYLS